MPKSNRAFWVAALLIAGGVDFLFWRKPIGISFPIWTLLAMGSALYLTLRHGLRPARANIALGVVIIGLASIVFLRSEPFTQALGALVVLMALVIWAATLRNGYWLHYTFWDYIRAIVIMGFYAFTRPFKQFPPSEEQATAFASPLHRHQGWAVLRGILLALPILGLLTLLLASADLVFAEWLKSALQALQLDNLPETLFRLFYVGALTIIFCGVLLHAVFPTHTVHPSPEKTLIPAFLGWTESSIVLGSVNALFLFFVILQFRYLFGGQANIHEAGFTYAEYARRGFGELVAVALISLMLLLALNTISRRETPAHRNGFTVLGSLLILLVLVILASALQRLVLYEQAYGFTRLRTYTYMFIPWLGLLLLSMLVLLITHSMQRAAAVSLVFFMGFGLLFGVWNVDGWIVRQNVQRAANGQAFDGNYLQMLSSDAVPTLIKQAQRTDLPNAVREELLFGLACRAALRESTKPAWQSFNFSEWRATQWLTTHAALWRDYPIEIDPEGNAFLKGTNHRYCYPGHGAD